MSAGPFIVVGLGNPGPQYAHTPHNLGFRVIDCLAKRWKADGFSSRFKGELIKSRVPADSTEVLLFKPMTFMNLSGEAVQPLCAFFKIPISERLLVVTDDLDTPKGQLRLRLSGGSGGHNGLVSLIQHLSTEEFPRLRLGVGRHDSLAPERYLLTAFPKSEESWVAAMVEEAATAVERCLAEGVAKAMNVVNVRKNV